MAKQEPYIFISPGEFHQGFQWLLKLLPSHGRRRGHGTQFHPLQRGGQASSFPSLPQLSPWLSTCISSGLLRSRCLGNSCVCKRSVGGNSYEKIKRRGKSSREVKPSTHNAGLLPVKEEREGRRAQEEPQTTAWL